jgi:hypothetical protein
VSVFRPDRYFSDLYQPNRESVPVGGNLYETQGLLPSGPGLYAFVAVDFAIGYVTITPYNAEAV